LRACLLIVELHEFAVPGITTRISNRFGPTHRIELVAATPRDRMDWTRLSWLDEQDARLAVDEGRPDDPPMCWAVMTPNSTKQPSAERSGGNSPW
jgi:hypothetical protein